MLPITMLAGLKRKEKSGILAKTIMKNNLVKEDISDLILDATDLLLARRGYQKMTIDELAREVGIGKGTVYLRFNSKEEIVLSHVDRIVARLQERLREIAGSKASCEHRLQQMLMTRVLFRFDSVQHYTESMSDVLAAIRPGLLLRREQHFAGEAEIFAAVLKEGQRSGALSFKNALATAHTLLLATNSLLPYSLSARELGARDEVEAKAKSIAKLVIHGLIPH